MDKVDIAYLKTLDEIIAEHWEKRPPEAPSDESNFYYKKYGVFKCTYNPATDSYDNRQIVFNAPKREADVIQRSQRSKTDVIDNEMVIVQKFEVRETSQYVYRDGN